MLDDIKSTTKIQVVTFISLPSIDFFVFKI